MCSALTNRSFSVELADSTRRSMRYEVGKHGSGLCGGTRPVVTVDSVNRASYERNPRSCHQDDPKRSRRYVAHRYYCERAELTAVQPGRYRLVADIRFGNCRNRAEHWKPCWGFDPGSDTTGSKKLRGHPQGGRRHSGGCSRGGSTPQPLL